MPERRRKFTHEFKDEAVKMVIETSRPIAEVARDIHVNEGTDAGTARCHASRNHAAGPPDHDSQTHGEAGSAKFIAGDYLVERNWLGGHLSGVR
jgi:transposase-like protein